MMHEWSREEYEAAMRDQVYGGDFWNYWAIVRAAFRDESVEHVRWGSVGTGLWVDVQVSVNGQWIDRRLYS